MARIFTLNFSLRKLLLVLIETALLTVVILPISDFGGFLNLVSGRSLDLPLLTGSADPVSLSGLPLLGFLSIRVLFIVFICQICFFFNDLYNWKITANSGKTYLRLLESVSYALILTAISYYTIQGMDRLIARTTGFNITLLKIHPLNVIACMALIYFVSYYYRIFFHWTHFTWKLADRLLMIGSDVMIDRVARELKEREDPSYEIVGYIMADPSRTDPGKKILGGYGEISGIVKQYDINRIIVSLTRGEAELPIDELLNCRIKGIHVEEATLLYERITSKIAIEKLDPMYLIFSEGFDQYKFTYIFKRLLDIGLALLGLSLCLPLILITAILIKFTSKGPVFFKQQRVGKEGKIFTLIKFRSMFTDAEEKTGPVWASRNDSRVTRVGHFIRMLRIDEIPQMWNVLQNEMSFVGPRPERPFFVEELKRDIPYYTERLVVKPGITGWAQINYAYGASKEDAIQKLQYDLYYIKNMSIFLDIIILLRTIKVVIRRQGAV